MISLRNYNTFGIDAAARALHTVDYAADLPTLLPTLARPLHIIGGGSNILLSKPLDTGTVLHIGIRGIAVTAQTDEHTWVCVGAGETWHDFVLWAIAHDLGGIENLALIPGTVGAAPIQNIGAYGVEVKDVFERLEAYDLIHNTTATLERTDCHFGYRDSVFKREARGRYLITAVTFRLTRAGFHTYHTSYADLAALLSPPNTTPTPLSLRRIADTVIHIRRTKLPDPTELGNAGSFFKNPEINADLYATLHARFPTLKGFEVQGDDGTTGFKISAAFLIEQAGWKGRRMGNAGTHTRQPLVIVNHGGATGEEVRTLAATIAADVATKFGVQLEAEVNMW